MKVNKWLILALSVLTAACLFGLLITQRQTNIPANRNARYTVGVLLKSMAHQH